jgi:hypothetical protein
MKKIKESTTRSSKAIRKLTKAGGKDLARQGVKSIGIVGGVRASAKPEKVPLTS